MLHVIKNNFDVLLNIAVILLLGLTIFYCWRLNNKIAALKDSKKDLGSLVKTFDTAIIKTHSSIANLKNISNQSSNELQEYVHKASELISDLSFMNETASRLADRLEDAIRQARDSNSSIFINKKHAAIDDLFSKLSTQTPANKEEDNYNERYIKAKEDLVQIMKNLRREG